MNRIQKKKKKKIEKPYANKIKPSYMFMIIEQGVAIEANLS